MLLEDSKVKLATFEACLEIICDKGHTPYIAVNTRHPDYRGLTTPVDDNGFIVLDISANAISGFYVDAEGIGFLYAEGGQKRGQGFVPMDALGSIFAKEAPLLFQPFPFKISIDNEQEPAKIEPVKPIKKGWSPRIINGGKS
jgi:stringent starvation protein B